MIWGVGGPPGPASQSEKILCCSQTYKSATDGDAFSISLICFASNVQLRITRRKAMRRVEEFSVAQQIAIIGVKREAADLVQ